IYGVGDAVGAELFAAHALVARAVKAAFAPDGITTWSSNERGANQEVPHAIQKPEPPVPDELLGASAERIRRAIGDLRAG
ncbi:MAG TPA: hypothetical protein VFH14_07905, partial [Gemmatimonadaceae bacterium]|nr:hypothetical protein [Gemmatimonadaceae bacterium]